MHEEVRGWWDNVRETVECHPAVAMASEPVFGLTKPNLQFRVREDNNLVVLVLENLADRSFMRICKEINGKFILVWGMMIAPESAKIVSEWLSIEQECNDPVLREKDGELTPETDLGFVPEIDLGIWDDICETVECHSHTSEVIRGTDDVTNCRDIRFVIPNDVDPVHLICTFDGVEVWRYIAGQLRYVWSFELHLHAFDDVCTWLNRLERFHKESVVS